MAYTKAQFTLPVVLATDGKIDITLNDAGPTVYTATVAAGTYHNNRNFSDATNLLKASSVAMATADLGASAWTPSEATGDLLGRPNLVSTRTDGLKVASLSFYGGFTALGGSGLLGFAAVDIAPAAPVTTFTGSKQADYLWLPNEFTLDDLKVPRGTTRSAVSDFDGGSVIVGLGSYDIYGRTGEGIVIEGVYGAKILHALNDRSDHAAMVPGLVTGDHNVTLQNFWSYHRTTEPIRYAKDRDTPSSYVEIEITDAGWLSTFWRFCDDMEGDDGPGRYYRVRLPAQEYVS